MHWLFNSYLMVKNGCLWWFSTVNRWLLVTICWMMTMDDWEWLISALIFDDNHCCLADVVGKTSSCLVSDRYHRLQEALFSHVFCDRRPVTPSEHPGGLHRNKIQLVAACGIFQGAQCLNMPQSSEGKGLVSKESNSWCQHVLRKSRSVFGSRVLVSRARRTCNSWAVWRAWPLRSHCGGPATNWLRGASDELINYMENNQ